MVAMGCMVALHMHSSLAQPGRHKVGDEIAGPPFWAEILRPLQKALA